MNLFEIFIFLVTTVQSYEIPEQATVIHRGVSGNTKIVPNYPQVNSSLKCGQWLNSFSEEITYKKSSQVSSNERCVWIIAVRYAIGYKIDISFLDDSTNKPDSSQELILTGLHSRDAEQIVLTNHKPSATGNFTIIKAQIVIITFHTGNVDGTLRNGFALKYDTIPGNSHVSTLSTHHILPSLTFEFKYPADRNTYDSYELATFVLPPNGNVKNCQRNFLWFKSFGFDPDYDCKDSIFVYKFKVSLESDGFYEYAGRLCHTNTTWLAEFNDILLLIFQSNANRQFSGFSFSFMGC